MRGELVTLVTALAILATPMASAAQSVRPIDADFVARICPGMGLSELIPGLPVSAQNRVFVEAMRRLPAGFSPFTEADLEITSWSESVAGITYMGASPDGNTNRLWAQDLERGLIEGGWIRSNRKDLASPLTFMAQHFEYRVEASGGSRTIFLEFDTPGALMLRCGDLRLFEVQQDESQGILEAGSKRPFDPGAGEKAMRLPDNSDCDDPELLNAFKDPENVDESSKAFQKFAASGGANLSTQARFHQRLVTWLTWKLLESGKVDRDRLWQLIDEPSLDKAKDVWPLTENMLAAMGKAADAINEEHSSAQSAAICKSFVAIILAQHATNQRDITYNMKLAEILEDEGRRLGIKLSD